MSKISANKRLFWTWVFALLMALGLNMHVAAEEQDPKFVVEKAVDALLTDILANKAKYQKDPKMFTEQLNQMITPLVDMHGIAKSVMTVRYSRSATPEQIQRFADVFKNSLLNFYGNALLEYNTGIKVKMLPTRASEDPNKASVNMEIVGASGAVYPVTYSMVKLNHQWKMKNVLINGINVGKLFRDEFAQSMQRNNNDLNKTINGWDQVVASAKNATKKQSPVGEIDE